MGIEMMKLFAVRFSGGESYHCVTSDFDKAYKMAMNYIDVYASVNGSHSSVIKSIVELSDCVDVDPLFENEQITKMKEYLKNMTGDKFKMVDSANLDSLHANLGWLIEGKTPEEIYFMVIGQEYND
jgi:hypothetical protein